MFFCLALLSFAISHVIPSCPLKIVRLFSKRGIFLSLPNLRQGTVPYFSCNEVPMKTTKRQTLASIKIDSEFVGLEVASFLREVLGISSRQLQKIVRTKGIRLNGRLVHSKSKLRLGDQLHVSLPEIQQVKIAVAEPGALMILFEDPWFLGVEKPAGLPTYAIHGDYGLANQVAGYFQSRGMTITPRPLHRLDTPTSGIVIFAKEAETQNKMAELWRTGRVKRFYWGLCQGILTDPLEITTPIDGMAAYTKVRPIQSFGELTELEVELVTGRTHQIRRHLASLGHPLLGDSRYGQKKNTRLALHATTVSFCHPHQAGEVKINSPIPFGDFLL